MPLSLKVLPPLGLIVAALLLQRSPAVRSSGVPAGACDTAAISWEPPAPRQGALFRVRVSGVSPEVRLSGEVAGQALHFSSVAGGGAESFAAVPIDGERSLGIVLRCSSGERTDSLMATLQAARADYPIDRLTVAPRFARRPDSATAERIRRESERARAVFAQKSTIA